MPKLYKTLVETNEYHYPGHQFTGPGTNLYTRLSNKVMPVNRNDALTLLHDIDYFRFSGDPGKINRSDMQAITSSDYSLSGLAIKVGLLARIASQMDFSKPPEGYTTKQTNVLGEKLFVYVKHHPSYSKMFKDYGIDLNTYDIFDPATLARYSYA